MIQKFDGYVFRVQNYKKYTDSTDTILTNATKHAISQKYFTILADFVAIICIYAKKVLTL